MYTLESLGTTFPFKDQVPILEAATVLGGGKTVSIKFNVVDDVTENGTRALFDFHFSATWLHAASPLLCGSEYYRRSPQYLSQVVIASKAVSAKIVTNGVTIRFESNESSGKVSFFQDTFPAWFLFAYAPFSGRMKFCSPDNVSTLLQELQSDPLTEAVSKTPEISLISYHAQHLQKPWSRFPAGHPENVMNHDHLASVPTYDAESVRNDPVLQRQLIQDVAVQPGFVFVYNVKQPAAYDEETLADEMYFWFLDVFGKPNQHPIRKSQVFQMCQSMDAPEKAVSQDYDLTYSLNMHNDSVLYPSSHAYLQVNYQTISDVTTRLTDGFACADYLKEKYPEYFHILSTTPVTYGIRHQLYSRDGVQSTAKKEQTELRAKTENDDFFELELVNSRPVIEVKECIRQVRGKDGKLHVEKREAPVQITHSPVKIGVSAISMPDFDKYMEANEKWYDIIEGREEGIRGAHFGAIDWPQDTMLIFNNHRMLHGRATIVNPGIQKFVQRPVDYTSRANSNAVEQNGAKSGENDIKYEKKPYATKYRRQMIGAHQHRVNTENRLRLLTMKLLEKHLSKVDLEVHSELFDLRRDGVLLPGNEVLACWFPRCPTKVLERMIVSEKKSMSVSM